MLKLVPLEIGRLEANLVAITGEEGSIVLPVPAWPIEHPDGRAPGLRPDPWPHRGPPVAACRARVGAGRVHRGLCVLEHFLDDMTVSAFGHDLDRQRESMRALATMRDGGCRLLFGHDPAQFAALPAGGLT